MPARVTISRRLRITLSPRRRAVVAQREDRKDDLRRHVRRGAGERALEDCLDILVAIDEERRIAEVDLPISATENSHGHQRSLITRVPKPDHKSQRTQFLNSPGNDRETAAITIATDDI